MESLSYIIEILPEDIRKFFSGNLKIESVEEIRIKCNRKLIYVRNNLECICPYICSKKDIDFILKRISNYSMYAFEEEIRQGYITVCGGHRIGICGVCVMENNKIKTIKHVASINIRISKEIKGCSDKVMPFICHEDSIYNTIIISPPRCGKTTLLRDICRNISNGMKNTNFTGKSVSIIDERSEIAACYKGVPQMEVGIRTDIMDNCPKSQGIMMCIRSMSPEVVICDEIGTVEDVKSILMALNSGVSIITTIHGNSMEDLYQRYVFKELLENKVFKRAIILDNKFKMGKVAYVYDFGKNQRMEVIK